MTQLTPPAAPIRRLVVVLGDQLDPDSAALDAFDPARDLILMCEAVEEARYVAQHKKRLILFFTAMRLFAAAERARGRAVLYHALDDPGAPETLAGALEAAVAAHAPQEVVLVTPGDWRVLTALRAAAERAGATLSLAADRRFLADKALFDRLASGRKRFILEDFYRGMRRETGWLLTPEGAPVGGAWNFDKENRKAFDKSGAIETPERVGFAPGETGRAVARMVAARFPDAPGALDGFDEPVTPAQAEAALDDFIANRLPAFGDFQDAMATGASRTLHHSRLSAALNLKMLDPGRVCRRAIDAYDAGAAPLNAVEGFVRQILGWREFVRQIYWREMPGYAARNALGAEAAVPAFFWTGETEMTCLRDALSGLAQTGYAHHIERLMVMGLFLMLLGAHPRRVHDWHMSMYLDAIDWVSLPNVLGMSQHGDGGQVGTKPYCASGAYIDRMSNHCRSCRFDPKRATGETACPFTTLYWDFLDRHEARFAGNRRMGMQLKNLARKDETERAEIRRAAAALKSALA